jgi:hypothetical protein
VNTFTTFSLTHELESYQGRAALERFIGLMYEQLAPGGRWVNVDVVGPPDGDHPVLLWLNRDDGRNDDWDGEPQPRDRSAWKAYLGGLSTYARFLRFRRDFRHLEGYAMKAEEVQRDDRTMMRLSLRDACEFLSKKDYLENWQSEMHETFCFWSIDDWQRALHTNGFKVHCASHAFANPWIVQNRYQGKVSLHDDSPTAEPLPFPVTTMLLIADKPRGQP